MALNWYSFGYLIFCGALFFWFSSVYESIYLLKLPFISCRTGIARHVSRYFRNKQTNWRVFPCSKPFFKQCSSVITYRHQILEKNKLPFAVSLLPTICVHPRVRSALTWLRAEWPWWPKRSCVWPIVVSPAHNASEDQRKQNSKNWHDIHRPEREHRPDRWLSILFRTIMTIEGWARNKPKSV